MVPVNTRSYAEYRVTNTGNVPLQMQRASVMGTSFGARTNCSVLYPRETCRFTIEFTPYFEGYHNGQFRMMFNQGYEIIVALSGQARRR